MPNPLARFSLKNIAPEAPKQAVEASTEPTPIQGPETPVTLPRLNQAVADFSTKLTGSRKALVDGLQFEIKGTSAIETQVDSQIAAGVLAEVKNEFMPFLRETLKNQFLQMEVVVRESAHVKPLLTSREIYEDMRSKNPLVEDLRRELGLEFE